MSLLFGRLPRTLMRPAIAQSRTNLPTSNTTSLLSLTSANLIESPSFSMLSLRFMGGVKTNSGAKKRFRVRGSGSIKRYVDAMNFSKSAPLTIQAASFSRTSNKDTDMTNSDDDNGKESTVYETLVKDSVEACVARKTINAMSNYLRHSDETGGEAELRRFFSEALSCAFKPHRSVVLEGEDEDEKAAALAGASLDFLKHQQGRLKIENEMSLYGFLYALCIDVLKEYYKRREDLARSQTILSEGSAGTASDSARQGSLKRRRVTVNEVLASSRSVKWVGRERAKEVINDTVRLNFERRMSCDHGDFTFLVASGHVWSGKTRTGIEVPHLVKGFCNDAELQHQQHIRFTDVVYLGIDFLNGAKFNAQFDRPDVSVTPSQSLGARLMVSYFDTEVLQNINHDEALSRILHDVLSTYPPEEKRVVPIVIHFDEHGDYIKRRNEAFVGDDGRRYFEEMLKSIGSLATSKTSWIRELHSGGRYFLVPITTGTSETDANFSMISRYAVWSVPLPALTFEQRLQMAKNCLTATKLLDKDRIEMILKDDFLFQVALADSGGLPGLIEFTCDYNFDKNANSVVEFLHDRTARYVSARKSWDNRMKAIFSTYLARRRAIPSMVLLEEEGYTVQDALDGGTILLQDDDEIGLAPALVSMFNKENSMINPLLVKPLSKTDKWTWQSFERIHLLYLAAVLAAMIQEESSLGAITLGTFLRSVQPTTNPYLSQPLRLPSKFTATEYKVDAAQCIPKAGAGGGGIASNVIDVDVFDRENVHQSHTGTPIIDGYVSLDVGNEGLTIFLQYKHSEPGSSSPSKVRVSQMNEEVEKLDFALGRHEKWEPERQWIFLWITNREVDIDGTAHERLLWVDKGSLSGHCPLIGNRGLVAC